MAAALAVVPVVTQALDWGSQATLTRQLSAGVVDGGHYLGWMLRRSAIFAAAASAGVAVVLALGLPVLVGIGCALYLWALGVVQAARAWPQVAQRFGVIASGKFVGRAIALAVTIVPLLLPAATVTAADLLPVGLAVGAAVEAVLLAHTWPRCSATHVSARRMWRGGGRIGLASMLGMAQQLDTAIVAAVAGAGQAGLYGAVSRWVAPLMLPSLAVGEVLYPRMAATRGRNALRSAAAGAAPALLLSLVGAILATVASRPLTSLLLGPAYSESAVVLTWLALGTIPLMFAAPVFTLLVARGHDRRALASRGIGSGAALVGLPLLSGVWGAPGAAAAIGLGNTLFLIFSTVFAFGTLRGPAFSHGDGGRKSVGGDRCA
ncbi:MAG: lipopolysaccharide biosynthesis protein [Anaerolineae bacterium]